MKYILTAAIIFLSTQSYGQLQVNVRWLQPKAMENRDTVYYDPSNKLEWPDFKGKPVENSIALAITSSGFGFTAGYQMRNGKGTLNINVYCYFSKGNSWVKMDKASDYALNHEQHHFDVSYIATCRFLERLRSANFTFGNYNELLTQIYNESTADMQTLQDQYDGQTRNGRSKEIQDEWNKKIDDMLGKKTAVATN